MIRRLIVGLTAIIGSMCVTAPSQAAVTWDLKPSGTGNWDWTIRGIYEWHRENGSFFLPYTAFSGFMWHQAADHCIEVATAPGRFVSNPDTRIWVKDGPTATNWQSVNDDFGGTLQSKARLWISFPVVNGVSFEGEYYVNIAPYNSSYEAQDFELIVTRRDLTEAACTTGQTTIPWVKIIGNGTLQSTLVFGPTAT